MAAADPFDDQAVGDAGEHPHLALVGALRDAQDRHVGPRDVVGHPDGAPLGVAHGPRGEPDAPLDHPAERAGARGGEGMRGAGVHLGDRGRGVHLVGEDDEHPQATGRCVDGDAHGGEQVGGAVGPWAARGAHRAGDDDRRLDLAEQVEQVGGLLDRVGPLGDDDAARPGGDRVVGGPADLAHVVGGQVARRALPHRARLDRRDLRQARDRGDEVVGGQRRQRPAAGGVC